MNRLGIALSSVRRESANGIGYAIAWFARRFFLRFVAKASGSVPDGSSRVPGRPITLLVPAVDKDLAVLEPCLDAARRCVKDPVAAFWIVAPDSPRIRALAERFGATWIHEDTILPRPAKELKTRGWVLQQLIKLNACRHVPTPDYVVLDADTIFLKPRSFFRSGKALLLYSDQYELLYNRSLELVFGTKRRYPVSFVTHHMLMQRDEVAGLLARIESRFHRPWWDAILHEVDQGHLISFSEYEMYGHHVMAQPGWRKRFALQYWHGLDMDVADLPGLDVLRRTAGPLVSSVSYHTHTQ